MKLSIIAALVGATALLAPGCKSRDQDHTLSAAEYVKRGVPDPEAPWTAGQCVEAARAVATIAKSNPAHLPRSRSKKSGAVYARYATLCIEHVTAPRHVGDRMRNLVQVMEASQVLLKAYGDTLTSGRKYAQEFMDLSGAFLLVWAQALPVASGFMKLIPPDAPSYESRMAGMAKMLSGVSLAVHGALAMVGNPTYPDFARAKLARRIEQSLPSLISAVGKERSDILQSLRDVAADSPNRSVRDPLERTIKAIQSKTPASP